MRVICGDFWGKRGPVDGIAADPRYLDIFVPAGRRKTLAGRDRRGTPSPTCSRAPARSRDASAPFGVLTEKETADGETLVRERTGNRSLVLFDRGDEVTVEAGDDGIRFLLVSGKPIEEPVAWYGPIVMNTKAELQQAVAELQQRHLHQAPVALCVGWVERSETHHGSRGDDGFREGSTHPTDRRVATALAVTCGLMCPRRPCGSFLPGRACVTPGFPGG